MGKTYIFWHYCLEWPGIMSLFCNGLLRQFGRFKILGIAVVTVRVFALVEKVVKQYVIIMDYECKGVGCKTRAQLLRKLCDLRSAFDSKMTFKDSCPPSVKR